MTTPTIEQLKQPAQYQLLAELGHQAIMGFVIDYYFRQRSWLTWLHYALTAGMGVAWGLASVQPPVSVERWMAALGLATVAFVVLIPLHELIHGLTYRAVGATDVRYGVSLRELTAYAVAHNFVAGGRAFTWVAIAPFVVISGALLIALVLFPAQQLIWLGTLFLHTTATVGDLALLNYFWLHRRQTVYTYDDADEKKSYFYARQPSA